MLVGMALYRSGTLTGEASSRTYWRLLLFEAEIGLALRIFDFAWPVRTDLKLDIHRISGAKSTHHSFSRQTQSRTKLSR